MGSGPRSPVRDDALARFGRADLAPLWREARRRFEEAGGPVSRLRLRGLSLEQRAAVADLLGWPRLPGPDVTVSVAALDRALAGSPAVLDTRGAVEALGGPVVDRRAQRLARREEREALWAWLAARPIVVAEPALQTWVASVRVQGLVDGSVERTRHELERAIAVLQALPAEGRPLSSVAEQVCHDPHGLDDGTRVAGLVLRALAHLRGSASPADATERRELWADAGVACDAISTSVLVAGLRPQTSDPLAASLRIWAEAGQVAAVTLAQLQRHPLAPAAARVWVVENPAVLTEALAAFGACCPPLVCTSGWPNVAVVTLLRQVSAGGASLAYHGDLDGEGLRIAAYVVDKTGAEPWRMGVEDYLAGVKAEGPAAGRVTDVPWDHALGPAMRDAGLAVPEERVMSSLLEDLSAARPHGGGRG